MERENKKIGQKRAFLNKPYLTSLTSCISYKIELTAYNKDIIKADLYDQTSIDFAISDCSRNIHLDFDISTKEHMRNSLFKLDTIIETCMAMKEDLKIARKEIRKGITFREQLDKKEKQSDSTTVVVDSVKVDSVK